MKNKELNQTEKIKFIITELVKRLHPSNLGINYTLNCDKFLHSKKTRRTFIIESEVEIPDNFKITGANFDETTVNK